MLEMCPLDSRSCAEQRSTPSKAGHVLTAAAATTTVSSVDWSQSGAAAVRTRVLGIRITGDWLVLLHKAVTHRDGNLMQ